jgi:hypothetical protein
MKAAAKAANKNLWSSQKYAAMGARAGGDVKRKSRVTNGKSLFLLGNGNSAPAPRFADILRAIVTDLGGREAVTEAQRQLARRAA